MKFYESTRPGKRAGAAGRFTLASGALWNADNQLDSKRGTQEARFILFMNLGQLFIIGTIENLTPRPQEFKKHSKKKSYYYLNKWFNLSGTQSLSFTMMRCFLITPVWSFLKILFSFYSSKIQVWIWDLILRVRRQVEFERWAENLAVGFYVTVRCLEKTNYCVLWAPLIYSYFHPQNYSYLVNAPHSHENFSSSRRGVLISRVNNFNYHHAHSIWFWQTV